MTSRAEKIADNQKKPTIQAEQQPADHELRVLECNAELKLRGNRSAMGVQTEGIRVLPQCKHLNYARQSSGLQSKYGQGLSESNYANEFCGARVSQLNTQTTLNKRNIRAHCTVEGPHARQSSERIKGLSSAANTYNHQPQYSSNSSRPSSAHDNRKHSNCGIDALHTTTTGVGVPASVMNASMARSVNRRSSKWPHRIASQEYSRQPTPESKDKASFGESCSGDFLPNELYMTSQTSSSFPTRASLQTCEASDGCAIDCEESEVLNLCLYNGTADAQFFDKQGSNTFNDSRFSSPQKPKNPGLLRKANSLGEVTTNRNEWDKNTGFPSQCQYATSSAMRRKTSHDCVLTEPAFETGTFDTSLDSFFGSAVDVEMKEASTDFGASYSIITSESIDFPQENATAQLPVAESWRFESAAGPCTQATPRVGRKGFGSKLPSPLGVQEKRHAVDSLSRGRKNFRAEQTSSVHRGQNPYQLATPRGYYEPNYAENSNAEYDFRNRSADIQQQGRLQQNEFEYAKSFESHKNNDMGVLSEFRASEEPCLPQDLTAAEDRMTVHSAKTYTVLTPGRCPSDTGYSGKNVSGGDRLLMTAMSQSLPMIRRDVRQQSPQQSIESNVSSRNSQCMSSQAHHASSTNEQSMEPHSVAASMSVGDLSQHHKMLEGSGHFKPFPHIMLSPHVHSQLDQHQRILQSTSTYQRESPKNEVYGHDIQGFESAAMLEHRRHQEMATQSQTPQQQPHESQYFPQHYRAAAIAPVSTYGVYPLLPPQHHFVVKHEGENQIAASTSTHKRPSSSGTSFKSNQLRDQFYLKPPPVDLDDLSDDERERMRVKRERNRVAAAKCRNRRRELLERLEKEAEQLEREQEVLRESVKRLQSQKRKLGVMLDEHETACTSKHDDEKRKSPTENKTEPTEDTVEDTDS